MGRYYSGSISGKFWVAVQDSDDATKFGGKLIKDYQYLCCTCGVDSDDENDNIYCDGCYESYEQHFNDAVEEGELEQEDKNKPKILIEEIDGSFYVTFEEEQLEEVQGHIAELEKVVSKFVKSFTMNAESDYEYDLKVHDEYGDEACNFTDKITYNEIELLARWCLAKQVEKCLIDNGECGFTCEA
jgi:hypothetical protein